MISRTWVIKATTFSVPLLNTLEAGGRQDQNRTWNLGCGLTQGHQESQGLVRKRAVSHFHSTGLLEVLGDLVDHDQIVGLAATQVGVGADDRRRVRLCACKAPEAEVEQSPQPGRWMGAGKELGRLSVDGWRSALQYRSQIRCENRFVKRGSNISLRGWTRLLRLDMRIPETVFGWTITEDWWRWTDHWA